MAIQEGIKARLKVGDLDGLEALALENPENKRLVFEALAAELVGDPRARVCPEEFRWLLTGVVFQLNFKASIFVLTAALADPDISVAESAANCLEKSARSSSFKESGIFDLVWVHLLNSDPQVRRLVLEIVAVWRKLGLVVLGPEHQTVLQKIIAKDASEDVKDYAQYLLKESV